MSYRLAFSSWGDEEINALQRVISSGQFTMGKEVKELELEFSKYFGSKHCVMVNSGSSANLIAIGALIYSGRLNRGDEVIVPAVSWSTTYHPLQQYGLKVKFIDIDLDTLNYDMDALEKAINENTKMIFIVNLLGNNNHFDKLLELAKINNLIVIEDNCESMGSEFNNKKSGTFGMMGTFSSFFSHHISTMEGGYVLTDDDELYEILKSLRAHGWTREVKDGYDFFPNRKDDFYDKFDFVLPGYNLRPLELEAAIGKVQLSKLEKIIQFRVNNAEYFLSKAKNYREFKTQLEVGKSSWFGFSIILTGWLDGKRKILVDFLENNSIDTRPIVAGNFTKNSCIKYYDHEIFRQLKNADYLHENGFFIGNNGKDLIHEIDYFFETVDKFYEIYYEQR